ncbi:MAG: DUF1996 domain-containing protein [Proteobacteria bacterium]|nr:MAG: DUF1996 domain-containing protein [Pseudomonadota bacterium]
MLGADDRVKNRLTFYRSIVLSEVPNKNREFQSGPSDTFHMNNILKYTGYLFFAAITTTAYVNCGRFSTQSSGSQDLLSSGGSLRTVWGDGWTGPDSPPQFGIYKSIPSNFNVEEHLIGRLGDRPEPDNPTLCGPGREGTGKPEGTSAFRFLCTPSHNLYDDPIVFLGRKGASHLHTFFGNKKADANSTFESLRKDGDSTCDGGPLNRSAYWMPAMMNGRGRVVMPDYVTVYYKRPPKDDPSCRSKGVDCVDLPRGLRMIFGYNMGRSFDSPQQLHAHWSCENGALGADGKNEHDNIGDTMCPVGTRVGTGFSAPDCWDGKNLDSKDHRAHVVFANYDGNDGILRCPTTHPHIIPTFTMKAWWSSDGPEQIRDWYLSSDRMPGMAPLPNGSTFHTDWFGAWDDDILKEWHENAIEKYMSCNAGYMGSGRGLARPADFKWAADPHLVDPPMVTPAMKALQQKAMFEMHHVYDNEPGAEKVSPEHDHSKMHMHQ